MRENNVASCWSFPPQDTKKFTEANFPNRLHGEGCYQNCWYPVCCEVISHSRAKVSILLAVAARGMEVGYAGGWWQMTARAHRHDRNGVSQQKVQTLSRSPRWRYSRYSTDRRCQGLSCWFTSGTTQHGCWWGCWWGHCALQNLMNLWWPHH